MPCAFLPVNSGNTASLHLEYYFPGPTQPINISPYFKAEFESTYYMNVSLITTKEKMEDSKVKYIFNS